MLRMRRCAGMAAAGIAAVIAVGGGVGVFAMAGSASASATVKAAPPHPTKRLCPTPANPHSAACMAVVRTDVTTSATPGGYGPSDLQGAYNLPSSSNGSGETVAIVDAYDNPNLESDLATYRSTYGLPSCTTSNGCFRKVNQNGATSPLPGGNTGWGGETSLDVDMVSAICPLCHILVVEANSAGGNDLPTAESTAITLGAKFVSNSWGGGESSSNTQDTTYNHPGVVITASAGDSGYGVEYPAASPYVVAVGGTSLVRSSTSRGWSETAWSGSGAGCSAYEPKPSWQHDSGCSNRAEADVSAVADPGTGVSFYDTYGQSGWGIVGGTSVAAPIVASTYALAGTPTASTFPASNLYAHASQLFDVTSGSDGSCGGSYLCTAVSGYDGPTGLGTPNGIAAFSSSAYNNVGISSDSDQAAANFDGVGYSYSATALSNAGVAPGSTVKANGVNFIWPNTSAGSLDNFRADGQTLNVSGSGSIAFLGAATNGPSSGTATIHYSDGSSQSVTLGFSDWTLNGGSAGVLSGNSTAITTGYRNSSSGTSQTLKTYVFATSQITLASMKTVTGVTLPTSVNQGALHVFAVGFASPPTGPIVSAVSSSLCVDDSSAATTNGNPIQIWSCNGTGAQQWTVEPDGSLRVLGGCMTVTGGGTTSGTKIVWSGCNGSSAQRWQPGANGSLVNPVSALCLDDPGSSTTAGTQLQIWSCNGTNAQHWTLPGTSGSTSSDFSVAVSPSSGSVTAGGSTTTTVNTAVSSGSAQAVSLSAAGQPGGVTVSFSPSSVTAGSSSTMSISTSTSIPAGSYTITVTGSASSGSHSATYTLTVNTSTTGGGSLANGGFETGSASPWVCQSGDAVVSSPVHSGSHAVAVVPTSSQTGECDQTLTLAPNHTYTLTGWVQGNYAYIGVSGDASASTWTSSSGWTQLTVSFTTGSRGNVTVYVHGWYSQGNVYGDDFAVS
jgi:hypothetical protein